MGRGGLCGLKNKLPANNNNGERSTRAAKKENKKETSFSDFFGYRNVAKWPRARFSLLFELPHTLPDFGGRGGFFFFFSLCKKRRKSCTILSFAVYLPGEKLSPPQPGGERETDSGNHSCR